MKRTLVIFAGNLPLPSRRLIIELGAACSSRADVLHSLTRIRATGVLFLHIAVFRSGSSKVDQLSILGVRSFDNTRSEVIQFFTPLTLIVGYNGSGKTTIIECLKYAATGDLPPNSKQGGAFIHDPKLCGEREVMAQVKMSFKSTSGARMVATRSLQVTVKKTANVQKTLEGQLLMVKDGQRTTISSKTADINHMTPHYLGVSKAILDSVIFCHQDESLWPMSEPSTLKKRFDDIFEAMKYTKAIDNLKVLRKKQMEELAKMKIIEQHAQENKEKGEKAERKSNQLYDEIEGLRGRSTELGHNITDANTALQDTWERAASLDRTVARLEGRRMEARAKENAIQDLRLDLKEMSNTDDELQEIIDSYEQRVTLLEAEIRNQEDAYNDLRKVTEEARSVVGFKQSEIGKFQAERDHYERQMKHRESLIKETARRHKIRGFDFNITEDRAREFMAKLAFIIKDRQAKLERVRQESQEALQSAQTTISRLNDRKNRLKHTKESAEEQALPISRKMSALSIDLQEMKTDESSKTSLQSSANEVNDRLLLLKEDFKKAQWDQRIRYNEEKLKEVEEKEKKLNVELVSITREAADYSKLELLKKEYDKTETVLRDLQTANQERIFAETGRKWSIEKLDSDFQICVDTADEELNEAESQQSVRQQELDQLQVKLDLCRLDLEKKKKAAVMSGQTVRKALNDDPVEYLEALQNAESNVTILKQDQSNFQNLQKYYSECLDVANKHNLCRLCRRTLTEKDKGNFLKHLQTAVSKAAKDAAIEELAEAEADLKVLRAVRKDFESWLQLENEEIPMLENDFAELETKVTKLIADQEKQDIAVDTRKERKGYVKEMEAIVRRILKSHKDCESLQGQIDTITLKLQGTVGNRSIDDIQTSFRNTQEELRSLRSDINASLADRDKGTAQLNELELEARDLKSKISSVEFQLREKAAVMAQIADLERSTVQGQEIRNQADAELASLIPETVRAQASYDDVQHRFDLKEREIQQEASKAIDSRSQLKLAEHDIHHYEENGGPQQLDQAKVELEKLETDVTSLESDQHRLRSEIRQVGDQLVAHTETKRGILDNQRYRRDSRALEAIRIEITELEVQDVETDKLVVEQEAGRLQAERNKLSAEQASVIGSLKSKDDQLNELIQDWETEYKDAAFRYKEAYVKVEATKAAVDDLGRYGTALDKAIMKFHSLKMEEINRIIEELWRKTYQGTDVDTILIRSDDEAAKGNKSYNYRVCMMKQDAEMDMRGRCSAGQKVLASIIIRLALAECFGLNCGLIALDEPTTNLDRDNIRALAEALAEIIRMRRAQANFQLIIITHDEEFLRYMQCADFCDYYYRISRNDRQKSIIERQSISEVI